MNPLRHQKLTDDQINQFKLYQKNIEHIHEHYLLYDAEEAGQINNALMRLDNAMYRSYCAVDRLVQQGYFPGENKLNLNSPLHLNALAVKLRYSNENDQLNDFTVAERDLAVHLDVMERKLIKESSFRSYRIEGFPTFIDSRAGIAVEATNVFLATMDLMGVTTDGKTTLDLKDVKRVYPEKIMDDEALYWAITSDKDKPIYSSEARQYLYNTYIYKELQNKVMQENSPEEPNINDTLRKMQILGEDLLKDIETTPLPSKNVDPEVFEKEKETVQLAVTLGEQVKEKIFKPLLTKLKDSSYQKQVFDGISKLTTAIVESERQRRLDKSENFRMSETLKSQEQEAKERQREKEVSHYYSDAELFALFKRNGPLHYTLEDLINNGNEYRKTIENLEREIKEIKELEDQANRISRKADRNNKKYFKLIEEARRRKQETASFLRGLTLHLSCISGVCAMLPGGQPFAAVLNAAATASRIGQEAVGSKLDSYGRKIERRIHSSEHLQNKLGRISNENRFQISELDKEIHYLRSYLLSHHDSFTNEQYRQELKDIIQKQSEEIATLNEDKKDTQKKLDQAIIKEEEANEDYAEAYREYEEHKSSSNKKAKNEAENEVLERETKRVELEKDNNELSRQIDSKEREKEEYERTLATAENVKDLKKLAENVISQENAKFAYEKMTIVDQDGKEKTVLTRIGEKQQALSENIAAINTAFEPERQIAAQINHLGGGFARELDYWRGGDTGQKVVDLGYNTYQFCDQWSFFQKAVIPQLTQFMKELGEEGIKSSWEQLNKIPKLEVFTMLVFPSFKMLLASLAIGRILYSFCPTKERPKSEFEKVIDSFQNSFQKHQEFVREGFIYLERHIDEVGEELRSTVIDSLKIVKTSLSNLAKKVEDHAYHSDWKRYEASISEKIVKIRTKKVELRSNIKEHINFLAGKIEIIAHSSTNGLEVSTEGEKIRFDLELISRHPEHFTGLFASRVSGLNAMANPLLLQEIQKSYASLSPADSFQNELKALGSQIQDLSYNIQDLKNFTPLFIAQAKKAYTELDECVNQILSCQQSNSIFLKDSIVAKQILQFFAVPTPTPLYANQVCEEKYFLSDLIKAAPLHKSHKHDFYSISKDKSKQLKEKYKTRERVSLLFGTAHEMNRDKSETLITTLVNLVKSWWNNEQDINHYEWGNVIIQENIETALTKFYSKCHFPELPLGILKICKPPFYSSHPDCYSDLSSVNGNTLHFILGAFQEIGLPSSSYGYEVHHQMISYTLAFDPKSFIQKEDIEKISAFSLASKEMKHSENHLLQCYEKWLKEPQATFSITEMLLQDFLDNPFEEIAKNGTLIPSLNPDNPLPLLFPNNLLKQIEQNLFECTLNLMKEGNHVLLPFWNMTKSNSGKEYVLTLHYRLNQKEDFCSFTLATFDKAAVECFKKLSIKAEDVPVVNLNEFVLQALYSGYFEAPMPGQGTFKLANEDVYIPNPKPFEGLFKLWMKKPLTLNYNSESYLGESSSVYGTHLQTIYGKNYFASLNSQSLKKYPDALETLLFKYKESYYLCKGMYKLREEISDQATEVRLAQEGLFAPENPDVLIYGMYLSKLFLQ